jgi:hypothetical protein
VDEQENGELEESLVGNAFVIVIGSSSSICKQFLLQLFTVSLRKIRRSSNHTDISIR